MKKIDYGIDAPGVIRNLFIIGVFAFAIGIIFPYIRIGIVVLQNNTFLFTGFICIAMGILMLLYSKVGKFSHRDRMLNMIDWKGSENVLDVGTGRGLLMIGAAKRLSTGKSTGIDIWNAQDLTSNNAENAYSNAEAESVRDKVEIFNESAAKMSFQDESFDVVLSNLCIHNISKKEDRAKACREIARVLKSGGRAVISDFKNIGEYNKFFKESGCRTRILFSSYFTSFPPLKILVVEK